MNRVSSLASFVDVNRKKPTATAIAVKEAQQKKPKEEERGSRFVQHEM
jgi:hypothetical protein